MCGKTLFIRGVLKDMLKLYPNDRMLISLIEKSAYTAPEIANQLWRNIFNYVSVTYNTDKAMYNLYHDGYKKYLDKFSLL